MGFKVLDVLDSMDSTCISTLCLSSLHSVFVTRYTLHVLDSMFIVTPCLSSIIIYVLLSMASYRRTRLRGNPKSSNFSLRSHARPRQSPQRIPREPCENPKSCKITSRSVVRPHQSMARGPQKLQLYLAFGRSTTPIHGKGCASRRKVGKSCNFTSRSRARPRQSTERVAKDVKKLQLYLAFARSTTPIHGKGCAGRIKVATLP